MILFLLLFIGALLLISGVISLIVSPNASGFSIPAIVIGGLICLTFLIIYLRYSSKK